MAHQPDHSDPFTPDVQEPDFVPTRDMPPALDRTADEEALFGLSHASLRHGLHEVVSAVLEEHFKDPRVREALGSELQIGIDAVIDDYVSAESITPGLAASMHLGQNTIPSSPQTLEQATSAFRAKLNSMVEGSGPGVKRGASMAVKLAPAVSSLFVEFARDETKLQQAQRAAEIILGRYLHPILARRLVAVGAGAARRAAQAQSLPLNDEARLPSP